MLKDTRNVLKMAILKVKVKGSDGYAVVTHLDPHWKGFHSLRPEYAVCVPSLDRLSLGGSQCGDPAGDAYLCLSLLFCSQKK